MIPYKKGIDKKRLEKTGIELIGFGDLRAEGMSIPEVGENGNTLLEDVSKTMMPEEQYN